ncbi:hypothetical protein CRENBAI_011750, partial [Crenichthys baileyi]
VAGLSLRDMVRRLDIWEELGVEPPHREESAEVPQASVLDASGMASLGSVTGTSHLEKAQVTAQDPPER